MADTPNPLFAPILDSSRLTLQLWDPDNTSHMAYILSMANTDLLSLAPNGTSWTEQDWRRFAYSVRMKPSDAHSQTPDAACVYIMYLKSGADTPIGCISLCRRVPNIPMDLGYTLEVPYRRKGYGSEAAERVSRYFKDEFGLKEMCIVTGENNLPSIRLARSIGFVDGGYVMFNATTRSVAFVLPGMKTLEGQTFTFWGDGKREDGVY